MKFFLIIGSNSIYTYENVGQRLVPQFIEGSEDFPISPNNISKDINSYMEVLANEKNLETTAKLEFEVIKCANENINLGILEALGEQVNKVHSLEEVLKLVIKKLLRDKKLMIETYGINYCGRSYKADNNKGIIQGEYNLLAYSIHCKDVAELMDK